MPDVEAALAGLGQRRLGRVRLPASGLGEFANFVAVARLDYGEHLPEFAARARGGRGPAVIRFDIRPQLSCIGLFLFDPDRSEPGAGDHEANPGIIVATPPGGDPILHSGLGHECANYFTDAGYKPKYMETTAAGAAPVQLPMVWC